MDRGPKVNGGRGAKLGYKNTELKGNGLPDCNREIRPAWHYLVHGGRRDTIWFIWKAGRWDTGLQASDTEILGILSFKLQIL